MAMFQKWVACGGAPHGLQLEAAIRMKKVRETEMKDAGSYVDWTKVLLHFQNDLQKAREFVLRRRKEPRGTVTDFWEVMRCSVCEEDRSCFSC